MVRTLDLAEWAGRWVALDEDDRVKRDAETLKDLLAVLEPTVSKASRSCGRPCRANRWFTGLAEPWRYNYTDFGEGRGKSPHPVLRAVVEVSTPGATATFQAIVDTGGPVTVVAADLIDSGGRSARNGHHHGASPRGFDQ